VLEESHSNMTNQVGVSNVQVGVYEKQDVYKMSTVADQFVEKLGNALNQDCLEGEKEKQVGETKNVNAHRRHPLDERPLSSWANISVFPALGRRRLSSDGDAETGSWVSSSDYDLIEVVFVDDIVFSCSYLVFVEIMPKHFLAFAKVLSHPDRFSSSKMAALTGRIQRLKGIIPAKLISADLGAPSLSSPLDRVSGEGERSLVNDFPIVKKAGTDSVAFPLVDDKDERTTVTDNNNFGEIGPTMELYAEPSITGKQAEVDMDIPTYAHVVLDKMIEPCLTADRVSDGEDVVIGEMQSSEGEEGERDEVDGPVMDQSEEGPVASESKGEVRGRRAEACKVFENVPQSKTDGPGAGYGHSGFVQNGAGQSWADIVGNREICYPRPLVSESNGARSEMELEFIKCSEDSSEEINVNKGTKRGGAENKEDKETDMDSDSGWHRVNKKKYGNRRKSQEKGQTVGKTKAQPSQ
ncbi:hypothetical protein U1Q18_014585, partial [Sarracenia purpurea var. burkii]